ncbi:MAG: glycine zipper family protein [Candidatus Entotheonellia bacterium]
MFHMTGKRVLGLALLWIGLVGRVPALGGELYIYPNKGQSAEQQSRDRYDCHMWAVQQTGVDPTRAQASTPPPPPPTGGVFKGAARGAAVGAIGGAIAGDAGEGAAIGAATGGVIGGMKQRGQARSQQQAQANQAAQQQSAYAAYDRALSACLSGRGYTVK